MSLPISTCTPFANCHVIPYWYPRDIVRKLIWKCRSLLLGSVIGESPCWNDRGPFTECPAVYWGNSWSKLTLWSLFLLPWFLINLTLTLIFYTTNETVRRGIFSHRNVRATVRSKYRFGKLWIIEIIHMYLPHLKEFRILSRKTICIYL